MAYLCKEQRAPSPLDFLWVFFFVVVVVVLARDGWGTGKINAFGKFLNTLLVVAPYAIEDMTISTISNISQFESLISIPFL